MDISTKRGFLVGLLGGAIALGVSFVIRIAAGGVFLPELAAQTLFSLTPGAVESKAVETLQSLAKYSAFTAAVGANVVVYGVLGALLFRNKSISEGSSRLERFVSFSLLPYLVLAAAGIAAPLHDGYPVVAGLSSRSARLDGPAPARLWSHPDFPEG